MWALMASGSRRKKRTAKIAKKKLPKRRYKKQVRIKKRQNKIVRKHYKKKYHKAKPKKRRYKPKVKAKKRYRKPKVKKSPVRKHVKRKAKKRRVVKHNQLTPAERSAKEWISWHESNDRWNIYSSAGCYGRYQLTPAYLHGDYSHENQSRTADRYVKTRYGGWLQAKRFWQVHHWY